ncbi:hypothetical protein LIR06_06080, partial [Mediterraneibacter faecis]|uniref:hypothetical protein n=1 Tax=Mediterraneibacter faecis TaxID=592978 RepID=UPI001D027BF3
LKEIFKGCCCLLFSYQGSYFALFICDSSFILSQALRFVKNFFEVFLFFLPLRFVSANQLIYIIMYFLESQELF